jgi:hypothetical protein
MTNTLHDRHLEFTLHLAYGEFSVKPVRSSENKQSRSPGGEER